MSSQHQSPQISRRTVLRGLALASGATILAACATPQAGGGS